MDSRAYSLTQSGHKTTRREIAAREYIPSPMGGWQSKLSYTMEAENFATGNVLTGGRVIFGVGRSYHTREVETFGSLLLVSRAGG